MLLMPFVENSFKHGFIQNGTLKVDITISCEAENLRFHIKNTSQTKTNSKHGIGLENIKKRLELLYKDQYTLDIYDNKSTFEVVMILKIT